MNKTLARKGSPIANLRCPSGGLTLLVLAFFLVCSCDAPPGDGPKESRSESTGDSDEIRCTLDIREPATFIDECSQGSESRYLVTAISDAAIVTILSGKGSIQFKSELITVSDDDVLVTIGINGQPCELDEAVSIAKEVCGVVGISSSKIDAWSENAASRAVGDRVCLQTDRNEFGDHSVEIRPSHGRGPSWRVLYTLSLDPPLRRQRKGGS